MRRGYNARTAAVPLAIRDATPAASSSSKHRRKTSHVNVANGHGEGGETNPPGRPNQQLRRSKPRPESGKVLNTRSCRIGGGGMGAVYR
jgi:hypothetical protein